MFHSWARISAGEMAADAVIIKNSAIASHVSGLRSGLRLTLLQLRSARSPAFRADFRSFPFGGVEEDHAQEHSV